MRKLLIWIAVALALGTGSWLAVRLGVLSDAPGQAATGQELPVQKADPVIMADAKVVPVQQAALSFATGGRVAEVLVAEGDVIAAGAVLARLDTGREGAAVARAEAEVLRAEARVRELRAGPRPPELAAARAALSAAEAQLAKVRRGPTEAEIMAAETDVRRVQAEVSGLPPDAPPEQVEIAVMSLAASEARLRRLEAGATAEDIAIVEAEVDRAAAQVNLLTAGVRGETIAAAEADLAMARSGLAQAGAALADTELRAPFTGTLAMLDLKPGQFVAPGLTVALLADLSLWQIETDDLTEISVVQVSPGQAATIVVDALPDSPLTGKVKRIKPFGENKQGDITYTVTIVPDRQDQRLRWNMSAAVTILPK